MQTKQRLTSTQRMFSATAAAYFFLAASTAAFQSAAMAADEVTVTVGVAAPLSGNNAAYGKDLLNGVQLAVDSANGKKLTIGGKSAHFVVLAQDDQADPKTAVEVAQLLADKKVAVVIGHENSGTTLPASRIYANAGIPMITPSATNPTITSQGFSNVFSTIATDAQNAGNAGKYAVEVTKAKRIAVLDDRTAFGQGEADEFVKAVKAANGNVVDREFTTDKAVEFSAQLTHIKSTNADLVFVATLNPQAAMIVKRMKQLGIAAQFVGGGGVMEPTFLSLAGGSAEGAMAWEYGEPIASLPGGAAFQSNYEKTFHTPMLTYAPFAYDATWAAIHAMQAANSPDPTQYLAKLHSQAVDGITGPIAFSDTGALKDPSSTLYEVKNGKWTPITTKH